MGFPQFLLHAHNCYYYSYCCCKHQKMMGRGVDGEDTERKQREIVYIERTDLIFFLLISMMGKSLHPPRSHAYHALFSSHHHHHDYYYYYHYTSRSERFHSNELNFTCPSRVCPASKLMRNAYFHTVVGLDHIHSHQLMAYRVCEAFQKCIPRENIKVYTHIKVMRRRIDTLSFLVDAHNVSFLHNLNSSEPCSSLSIAVISIPNIQEVTKNQLPF